MTETSLPVRVVVCDDQRVIRDGLATILGMCEGVTVVGTASNGVDALRQVAETTPDVVLMDLDMPVMNGADATRLLREHHPAVGVVVLTTYAEDEWMFEALEAGAQGFLTKDASAEQVVHAIGVVASGSAALDSDVQARLLARFRRGERLGLAAAATPEGIGDPQGHDLTPREVEVVTRIAGGLSNAEIAGVLIVTEATIKTHINHIFAKTGVRNRAELVTYAYETGLAHTV